MAKLTLGDFGSQYNSWQRLNANNTLTENALENTLSRNGQAPNQMEAVLDMNSHRVINTGQPIDALDAVRLIDLQNALTPFIPAPTPPVGSRLVFLSSFTTLEQADAGATAVGGTLIIDKVYTLTANHSMTTKDVFFLGGRIIFGNFDLTWLDNSLTAGKVEIFTHTGTGRVKGTFYAPSPGPSVEWWGADPTDNPDSGQQAKTKNAFQYVTTYANQSDTPNLHIQCSGVYDMGTGSTPAVTSQGSIYAVHPVFVGDLGTSEIRYSPSVEAAMFLFVGQSYGGVDGFVLTGNTNLICVEICGGIQNNCHIITKVCKRGIRYHNRDTGQFTEECEHVIIAGDPNQTLIAIEYKVTNGNDSFNGTGFSMKKRSIINFNTDNCAITLTPSGGGTAAYVYGAAINCTFFPYDGSTPSDAHIVKNNNLTSRNVGWIDGYMGIENFSSYNVRLVRPTDPVTLFPAVVDFLGNNAGQFIKKPGVQVTGIRRVATGADLIDFTPLRNVGTYAGGGSTVIDFPSSTGNVTQWLMYVQISGNNYVYAYCKLVLNDDQGIGQKLVDFANGGAVYNLDGGGLGSPTFSVNSAGVRVTLPGGAPTSQISAQMIPFGQGALHCDVA